MGKYYITGSTSQVIKPQPGYSWRVINLNGTVTGTATADSTLLITKNVANAPPYLLNLTSTSTVLTVSGASDDVAGNGGSNYILQNVIITNLDGLAVGVTNNGSISYQIEVEEFIS